MFDVGVGDVLVIDGQEKTVEEIVNSSYFDGVQVGIGEDTFVIFENDEDAESSAREYWEDMAQNDPREFVEIVGADQVITWAFGTYGNLNDWLENSVSAAETFRVQPQYAKLMHWEFEPEDRDPEDEAEVYDCIVYEM